MGTLFNQPPRDLGFTDLQSLEDDLVKYLDIAKKLKVPLSDVISAARVCEMKRANTLYVDNGDAWDEQLSGLGTILLRLTEAIETMNS